MDAISNLKDLLLIQIYDLFECALAQLKVLPEFEQEAESPELKLLLARHFTETHEQIHRLDSIMEHLHTSSDPNVSAGMTEFIEQGNSLIARCTLPVVKDAAIVTIVQHLTHYDIAGYGAASAYANEMNAYEIASALHEAVKEEKAMNDLLSQLAKSLINKKAISQTLSK